MTVNSNLHSPSFSKHLHIQVLKNSSKIMVSIFSRKVFSWTVFFIFFSEPGGVEVNV